MIDLVVNFTGCLTGMAKALFISALTLVMFGCSNAPVQAPGETHLRAEKADTGDTATIPAPVQQLLALPRPKATPRVETYSVVVNNVSVQELLFALARDAKINVDVHPDIKGTVTMNAIDQTLQQLLKRISRLIDIRWEFEGSTLSVIPDKPFLRTYKIDFPNISREVSSKISTTTQVGGASGGGNSASAGGGNSASTSIENKTKNDLMVNLIKNVEDLLKEEDKFQIKAERQIDTSNQASTTGAGRIATSMSSGVKLKNTDGSTEVSAPGSAAAGSGNQSIQAQGAAVDRIGEVEKAIYVFGNKETGVLSVRATSRQHEKVQQFIDQVMSTAKRQVLIEATIAEVTLKDGYQQGIEWNRLSLSGLGFQLAQRTAGNIAAPVSSLLQMGYTNPNSPLGNISGTIKLLESFGNVKVLSSPKLSVMNNQTATLAVADNKVYFTVRADTTTTSNGIASTTFTTTPHIISVGVFMNVTPQISDINEVTLNIRPTITRITGYVNDPNPSLAAAGVVNRVPEIQAREMESIIKISSGQIAVMGGLMQDEINYQTDAVPAASSIPLLGNLFQNRNNSRTKTELVIFLRPIIVKDASIAGDYAGYRNQLPDQDYFGKNNAGPERQLLDFGSIGR